jgi:sirohydrochlorin cobaltochelatase
MLSQSRSALVLVGHGSTLNPDSSAPTFLHADTLKRKNLFAEVHCAFWKEEPSLREILRMVEAEEIYVVPNFISEGYFTKKVIPRELELTGRITQKEGRIIKYCEPVGNDPRMVDLLLQRAREVAPEAPPSQTSLVIVGHGTGLNENSAIAVKRQVRLLQERACYAEVVAAYMEEVPRVDHWEKLTTQPHVVIVPFFIADGLHSYQDIPVLLGIEPEPTAAASKRDIFRRNPHKIAGRNLYYAAAIGTDSRIAEMVVNTVENFDRSLSCRHSKGKKTLATDAFLKQLLQPKKTSLRIGELVVITDKPDSFHLMHQDDFHASPRLFHQPKDAREIAKYDRSGEFRPLKGAPNLKTGWRLDLSSVQEVREALDYFYPGAISSWIAYDRLSPVTLRETLERQSGMYRVTRQISDTDANRVIEKVCNTQTGCLRKILWSIDERQPNQQKRQLDLKDQHSGIPYLCVEACNWLVAAMRKEVKNQK